jgi:hypothetical protein
VPGRRRRPPRPQELPPNQLYALEFSEWLQAFGASLRERKVAGYPG